MAAELFDTHCHIQSAGAIGGERTTRERWAKAGDVSVDDIVVRAHEAGVQRMMCVGCDLADSQLAIDCVKNRDGLYASIGIHPHEAAKHRSTAIKSSFSSLLGGQSSEKKIVAIGECGLDYFYTHSPKDAQLELLQFQLELALEHDLPLIFHVREAFDDFWPLFERYPGLRGVLHSFTDSAANLERALGHGLYIGVNGIVTFAKQPAQLAVYRAIPLESLVLETDAPFLTPVPSRGTMCEPYHIRTTAEFLAELRGESIDTVATTTTRNAAHLFGV